MVKYDAPLGLENENNLQKLVGRIRPNSVVLEFGPSTGRLTQYLTSELNCTVYGVEIDSEAFSVCRKYLKDGLCADIEEYTWLSYFKDLKFDFIIFADVLEHLKNPKKVINEVKKFLKNDSEILVSIPNIAHNSILIELLNNRFDYTLTGLLDSTHIHFFTAQTCIEMFEDCGYNLLYSNGTVSEPYNTEIRNSFDGIPEDAKQFISSRDYGNLYQILFSFSIRQGEYDNQLINCRNREYYMKIYLDYGDGLSEKNVIFKKVELGKKQKVNLTEKDVLLGCVGIAIVPLDNYLSKCKINYIKVNDYKAEYREELPFMKDSDEYSYSYQGKRLVCFDNAKKIEIELEVDKVDSFSAFNLYSCGYQYAYNYAKKQEIILKKKFIEMELKKINKQNSLYNKDLNKKGNNYLEKINRILTKFYGREKQDIRLDIILIGGSEAVNKGNYCFINHNGFIKHSDAEYVTICFNKAEPAKEYFDSIYQHFQEIGNDVIFADCFDKEGKAYYKSDYSYEYLIHQIQEYDVISMKSDIYNILVENFDCLLINNSYEFMLVLIQVTENIGHISKPLYKKNINDLTYDSMLLEKVRENISWRYNDVEVKVDFVNSTHVKTTFFYDTPKVSIIIPMKDKWELTNNCIESILNNTTYKNYEILILNNNSEDEETFNWFKQIQKNERIKVLDALFEFNWSKLNNFGIENSDADVFVFLNNDTLVITPDWIENLCSDAMRPDIGVVGALLLYDDDTVQHAGVVIGMNDFADHIFKQLPIDYENSIFVNPLDKRNVMAVTGACMAISRNTLNKIGMFNDTFIICGSDVEICIRAYKMGLRNIFTPYVKLYHLESKSRDSYIPPIDFEMSIKHYAPYREEGDPYFNINLSYKDTTPKEK